VPLAWLADLDSHPSPDALADAFGDRYLCEHNAVFARVRRSALELGYHFSAEDTPLWRDYQVFALTTLHRILEERVIPYCDTRNAVERLLKSNRRIALPPAFVMSNLKANYAFHESAHCVAHSVLRRMETALRAIAPNDRERFVLEAILAESFANTVETLGSLVRKMPLSDTLFYSLNSYMSPKQDRLAPLEEAGAKAGELLRFALLFLASFEANLASADPEDSTRGRVAMAGNCCADQAEVVRTVTDAAFRLNLVFREKTTPGYFELLGYASEYNALARALWLSRVENQHFIRELIPVLFECGIGTPADRTASPSARR
jgi:hypothetical protein